jgi:regulatory protein
MKVYLLKKDRARVYKSTDIAAHILETEKPFGFGPEDIKLTHGEKGEPCFEAADGVGLFAAPSGDAQASKLPHISISDTRECWLAVLSLEPVGFDVEEQSRRPRPASVKALHPLEQQYLSHLETESSEWREEFLHIWTAKEAYSKFCGEGLRIGFSRFSVLEPDLSYSEQVQCREHPAAHMHFERTEGLCLCLAASSPCPEGFELKRLYYAAPFKESALEAAAGILDRGMLSERELRQKLKLKGYPEEDIAAATEALKARGYLDDAAYAARYISRARDQGKGRFRIESELAKKGIDKAASQAAFGAESDDENAPSEMDLAMAQAERMAAGKEMDDKLLAKVARKLAALGFGSSVIYAVLDRLRK